MSLTSSSNFFIEFLIIQLFDAYFYKYYFRLNNCNYFLDDLYHFKTQIA